MATQLRYSFLVTLLFTAMLFGNAQNIAFSYKGDWSSWQPLSKSGFSWDSSTWGGDELQFSAYTDMSGFIFKSHGGREIFKFQITNFRLPSKEERKRHLKDKEPYIYYGTVDYYVNDYYPTAEELAKNNRLVIPDPRNDQTPSVMRHTICEIKINPYKDNPQTYNIFFDNIGIAVDVQGMKFGEGKNSFQMGTKRRKNKGRVTANIVQSVLLFPIGLGSWLWNPVYDN